MIFEWLRVKYFVATKVKPAKCLCNRSMYQLCICLNELSASESGSVEVLFCATHTLLDWLAGYCKVGLPDETELFNKSSSSKWQLRGCSLFKLPGLQSGKLWREKNRVEGQYFPIIREGSRTLFFLLCFEHETRQLKTIYEIIISISFSDYFVVIRGAVTCSQQRRKTAKNSDSKTGSYQAQAGEGHGVRSQRNASYGIVTI